jgi:predicted MFS family arabinose efflux permease
VLTQSINWHWIFFINVPIGIATAVLALRLLPKDKGIGFAGGADVPGAVLITAALMTLVYTIVEPAAKDGWGATSTLGLGALAVALLAAFLVREATAKSPLIPLRIFRSRNVSGANAVQALAVAGMFGMFFLGALYLQRVLGYDALQTGVAFLPATLVMAWMSLGYSQKLIMRFGARSTLIPGLALIAAALALFGLAPVDGRYVVNVLPVMVLLGAGAGVSFPALMTLAMSGATPSDAGLASGLVNTTVQVGGALGLAVLATLSATRSGDLAASGESQAVALTGGYHLAFLIGAALVTVAVGVAAVVLQGEKKAARRAARASRPALSEA